MSELEKNLYKRVTVPAVPKTESASRAYRGFSTVYSNTNDWTVYDFELVKQDLINHFHIRQGEKLSDPEFGCIIWDLLYEPFTQEVQTAIIENVTQIVNYDPRLQVTEVVVDTYDQGIQVEASVVFLNYNIADTMRFKFDQNNGLN
jgi:phage baseplate assembly protein W